MRILEDGAIESSPTPDVTTRGPKVLLGIPLERTVTDYAFLAFMKLMMNHQYDIIDLPYGRADVTRNIMARILLGNSQYDFLCMLDCDHIHPANVVESLLARVIANPEIKVIGGLNFKREAPYEPCAYFYGPDGILQPPSRWARGSCYKVDAIGTGCILIHRDVFIRIPFPWFRTVMDERHNYPGDDLWFSKLCYDNKIDIWCDTGVVSPHLVTYTVDENSFNEYAADHPFEDVSPKVLVGRQ